LNGQRLKAAGGIDPSLEDRRTAPYLSVTPNRANQILKAPIDWSTLLSGSGLNNP
jgi:hypothetical protein